MLDVRQRTVLWGLCAAGVGLVFFVDPPRSPVAARAADWGGKQRALLFWETSPFGRGGLPMERRILEVAARHGVDPALIAAVVQVESGFRPDVVSPKGAVGLMQLMPDTAALLGVSESSDPHHNLEAGTRYLAGLLEQFGGDVELALAAYNAGPGAVRHWGTVPPFRETRSFIWRVDEAYRDLTGVQLRAAARLLSAR